MRAVLKNFRQSPRKMRLVADAVKGRTVGDARALLSALPKAAARPLAKLLESAVGNAKENQKAVETDSLRVTELRVDGGPVLKRFMPRARGSGYRIRKRTSTITLVLSEKNK
ncbi:MAG: large subunit ribosomal protein L22 [Parcubacteria group bacterium Greene0416_79]|nr:MAG: large subunit ribosomal protein L22 [Parcubacteria group bacterium Greene0416_79]